MVAWLCVYIFLIFKINVITTNLQVSFKDYMNFLYVNRPQITIRVASQCIEVGVITDTTANDCRKY